MRLNINSMVRAHSGETAPTGDRAKNLPNQAALPSAAPREFRREECK